MTGLLEDTIAAVGPLDAAAVVAARERQEALTKPSGSLGRLEDVSVQLAGIAGRCPPPLPEPAVVAVFAADHGVHALRALDALGLRPLLDRGMRLGEGSGAVLALPAVAAAARVLRDLATFDSAGVSGEMA